MFLRLFKSNSPFSIIIIPLLALSLWLQSFLSPLNLDSDSTFMPLYNLLATWLHPYPIAATVIAYVLVALTAFLYNHIANEHELLPKRTYLPGLFYCFLMSASLNLLQLHPLVFANLFIILSLHSLLKMYRQTKSFSGAFESGLYLSFASLFYFPSALLLFFLFMALVVLRPFIWREWVISFFGFILSYVYILTYYFWNNNANYFFIEKVINPITSKPYNWDFFRIANPALWLFSGLLLLALAGLNNRISTQKLKTQKGYILLFWLLPFSLLTILLAPEISMLSLSVLTVPSGIIIAHYFYHLKRMWMARALLWIIYLTELIIIWRDKIDSL